jgi:hypothetical protein
MVDEVLTTGVSAGFAPTIKQASVSSTDQGREIKPRLVRVHERSVAHVLRYERLALVVHGAAHRRREPRRGNQEVGL